MILSDSAIVSAMERGEIVIKPFDRERLGSNSYDVTLAKTLGTYVGLDEWNPLDVKMERGLHLFEIQERGLVLLPGVLYLAATNEYTESRAHVPTLSGKSSLGRLGIAIHVTAGVGDVDFCGFWTLEITVVHPVRVYAGMPIGQILWHTVEGKVERPYGKKASAKYANQGPMPVASQMWKNFR